MQIFSGFSQDTVQDLTNLKPWEVKRCREYGLVNPEKTKLGYKYTFADLLMLRLCYELKYRYEVQLSNIRSAIEYFQAIDPEQSLQSYSLFVRSDTKELLYFGTSYDEKGALVSASRFGQLAIEGVIIILPVGRQLEAARQNVIRLDAKLDASLQSGRLISLAAIKKKFAND